MEFKGRLATERQTPVVEFQEWKLSWSLDLKREFTAEVRERFTKVTEAEGEARGSRPRVCVFGR